MSEINYVIMFDIDGDVTEDITLAYTAVKQLDSGEWAVVRITED